MMFSLGGLQSLALCLIFDGTGAPRRSALHGSGDHPITRTLKKEFGGERK